MLYGVILNLYIINALVIANIFTKNVLFVRDEMANNFLTNAVFCGIRQCFMLYGISSLISFTVHFSEDLITHTKFANFQQ